MEVNDQTYGALQQYLQQTLNPATQKEAERQLAEVEVQPGFPLLLLKLLSDNNADMTLRFAGSLYFKNYIKRHWVPDNPEANKIAPQDRATIKSEIDQLMVTVPDKIQLQIGDALSVIAAEDFPRNWENLLGELVSRLSTTDYRTNNGILHIAHSVFKRWRHEFDNNYVLADIQYVLERFCEPYIKLFQVTDNLITENTTNEAAMRLLSQSLILLIKIYYDLNCIDLPEFFEDHLNEFMALFQKYLVYGNTLIDSDDEDEAGPLEKIKTCICEVLELYTLKYEELVPQLESFAPIVYELLATAGHEGKYDAMVCKGLSLLTSMLKVERLATVFSQTETMKNMCEKIALPSIAMREVDEELFEDNPIEYIRRDLEGSDSDTRRRAAADFLRGYVDRYEAQITQIMSQYITHYLERYNANPQAHWKDKNTAIFLLVAIASRSSTALTGVTKTNSLVDIVDFFSKNILGDLQSDVNAGVPILKVDAIKYIYTFRSILTKEQLLTVFPLLVKHLESQNYVVHTYAAITIERILFLRQQKTMIFTAEDISPYAEALLSQLFKLIEAGQTPEKLSENDYLMRAVMRVIITCRQSLAPYVNVIMGKLTSILGVISRNPSNPRFNHFVFESIGALIRFICPISENAVTEFEKMLFGPFQNILTQDGHEFMPYVFQLLAQLLEQHRGHDLTADYVALLNPLMNPPLWEQGNIPALVRLIQTYLAKGANTILAENKLEPILGIFQQKLVNSRQNDHYGMLLLEAVTRYIPFEILSRYLPALVTSVLTRLQSKKRGDRIVFDRFTRNFTLWVCLYCVLEKTGGPDTLIRVMDSLQRGLFGQIFEIFVAPDLVALRDPLDSKMCGIAVVRLLTQSELMLQEPYVFTLWPKALRSLYALFELPPLAADDGPDEFYTLDVAESGYQTAFSKLATASASKEDPVAAFPPAPIFLAQQLISLPPDKRALIKTKLPENSDILLPKYFEAAGLNLAQL